MKSYFSLSQMTAGFVAVMIGFTSTVVLVFQAAIAAGANTAEISSWLFALGFSIAISCIALSLYYRMPILIGWSTPGAALLVTSLAGIPMSEAVGAFVFAAVLTIISGATGLIEKILNHIPKTLPTAMLAGILLNFGIKIFAVMQQQLFLVAAMVTVYLIGKRIFPRTITIFVLIVGICIAQAHGLLNFKQIPINIALPIFTYPVFTLSTLMSIGLPLFLVTTTSQNIPGLAVITACGFKPPINPVISFTGLINGIFACFGCYSISLTALTAAICASPEADKHPGLRYRATIFSGICWICIALFGGTVVAIFSALPKELLTALAGLALLNTLSTNLTAALEKASERESALITILITASGFSLFGVGSACWGLIGGLLTSMLQKEFKKVHANKEDASTQTN